MRLLIVHEHQAAPGQGGGGAESLLRDLTMAMKGRGHEVAWLQSGQIARAVDEYQPDVVQVITIHNRFGLAPAVWLQEHRVPHIWAVVDYWPFCLTRNLLIGGDLPCSAVRAVCDNVCGQRATWQEMVNRSPVVALCEPEAVILRRNGIRVDYVCELGVDTDLFRPGLKVGDSVHASCAWGLHRVKGQGYLMEAARHARLDARLLTGQPRDGVARSLAPAPIYAQPTIYEESWCLALTEAMACGCACVGTDVAGVAAQLHPHLGILVPPRDVNALAEALAWLIHHPDQRAEMGQASRAHVEAQHSLEAMGQRWERMYREVLAC